jgi:hypothetical protein
VAAGKTREEGQIIARNKAENGRGDRAEIN